MPKAGEINMHTYTRGTVLRGENSCSREATSGTVERKKNTNCYKVAITGGVSFHREWHRQLVEIRPLLQPDRNGETSKSTMSSSVQRTRRIVRAYRIGISVRIG